MKKLVVAGEGGDTFFPLFFVLQTQILVQARLVAEKARVKANESKTGVEGVPTWIPKKQKVIPKIHGVKGNPWPAPVSRDKAAIMEAGVTMSDADQDFILPWLE